MSVGNSLHDDAQALGPELVQLRRRLHQQPEIGLDLPATQQLVLDALDGLPVEVSLGTSSTSVTAVLRGSSPGPAVLLRGDMDALPVAEESGEEFASRVPGAMHACGHDLHTAMLVGAIRLLATHRAQLAGDVVFMFQPGEEGWDGAGHMLSEGVLEASGQRVSAAYGMHVIASQPTGIFTSRPGTLMAASAALNVKVRGAGGHGSMPHHAKDPVSVAAQLVGDLQTLITRRFDIFDPVVLTVGSFHAGTARNIIPDDATFLATVRTFSPQTQDRVEEEVLRLCRSVAMAYDVDVDAEYIREYPPTVNDIDHARFVESVVTGVFGNDRYAPMETPHPGSEDFSRVIAEVPGCYLMLGASVHPSPDPVYENHSPRVRFAESVMPDGVELHAQLAIQALHRGVMSSTVASADAPSPSCRAREGRRGKTDG